MGFKNKNILVTGGSKGIGKATALIFARNGANVGINYKSNDVTAQSTLSLLRKGNHRLFKGDISDEKFSRSLVDDFINIYGKIDILVNKAGIAKFHEIDKVSFEEWRSEWKKTINTNLLAVANICYFASVEMIKNNTGRIS